MRLISSIIMLLFIFSYKQSDKENQLLQKEAELIKKEKLLNSKRKQLEGKELLVKLNSDVKRNVIHCDNKKFTIKIDRLINGELRYLSWNRPKSISDEPVLILYDGKVERQGTAVGYHYFFTNGNRAYLKINGNLEIFRLAKSKSLTSLDRTEATWVNENFEFDIKTEQIGQIDETWQ